MREGVREAGRVDKEQIWREGGRQKEGRVRKGRRKE